MNTLNVSIDSLMDTIHIVKHSEPFSVFIPLQFVRFCIRRLKKSLKNYTIPRKNESEAEAKTKFDVRTQIDRLTNKRK